MLKLINLYVIDQVWKEALTNVSVFSKMLYLNCLTHHFKDKTVCLENAMEFELCFSEHSELKTFNKNFEELQKAGLVEVKSNAVLFPNLWYKYIDKEKLTTVINPITFAGLTISSAEEVKKALKENQHLFEIIGMKHGISQEKFDYLVDLFVLEQLAYDKKYSSHNDCAKHFSFWIPFNLGRTPNADKKKPKILGE